MLKQVKLLGLVTVMSLGLNLVGCEDVEDTEIQSINPQVQEQLNTLNKEQKLDNKEENKKDNKEEKKKEEMGQCYDCGEYKPIKDMTFNGRSYHCGCTNKCCFYCNEEIPYGKEIREDDLYFCNACYSEYMNDKESEEPILVCPGCDGSYYESDMIEETNNGIMYCSDCYGRIMNDIMGGDANGDLEPWEY